MVRDFPDKCQQPGRVATLYLMRVSERRKNASRRSFRSVGPQKRKHQRDQTERRTPAPRGAALLLDLRVAQVANRFGRRLPGCHHARNEVGAATILDFRELLFVRGAVHELKQLEHANRQHIGRFPVAVLSCLNLLRRETERLFSKPSQDARRRAHLL
jgi:hypothetical protein